MDSVRFRTAFIAQLFALSTLLSCADSGPDYQQVYCQESSQTQLFSEVAEGEVSPELSDRVSLYDGMTGTWAVEYACRDQETQNATVVISLPTHDEIDIVLGPPENLAEDEEYSCDYLGFAFGELVIDGTGDPLLDGVSLSLLAGLIIPDERYPDEEWLFVEGRADQDLESHDIYESFYVSLKVGDDGLDDSSTVGFHASLDSDSARETDEPYPDGSLSVTCFFENWVRIE
ncbi:hypothetical protein KAI87_03005 [Myxococcota bacterium]|nr:hypothetical protein [Myxococcota bacterium]